MLTLHKKLFNNCSIIVVRNIFWRIVRATVCYSERIMVGLCVYDIARGVSIHVLVDVMVKWNYSKRIRDQTRDVRARLWFYRHGHKVTYNIPCDGRWGFFRTISSFRRRVRRNTNHVEKVHNTFETTSKQYCTCTERHSIVASGIRTRSLAVWNGKKTKKKI
jgi:hypothetical protein